MTALSRGPVLASVLTIVVVVLCVALGPSRKPIDPRTRLERMEVEFSLDAREERRMDSEVHIVNIAVAPLGRANSILVEGVQLEDRWINKVSPDELRKMFTTGDFRGCGLAGFGWAYEKVDEEKRKQLCKLLEATNTGPRRRALPVRRRRGVEWKEARRPHVPHHVVHELRFAGHLYQVTLDIEPLSSLTKYASPVQKVAACLVYSLAACLVFGLGLH